MKKIFCSVSLPVLLIVVSLVTFRAYAGNRDSGEVPPRKVVIGTVIHGYYGITYPGLDKRLSETEDLIDSIARESDRKYPGEGLDLVVLPEEIVTIGKGRTAQEKSVPLEGPVLDRMGAKARQYSTYLIIPLDLAEKDGTFTNSAVLLDRKGEVAGIYRKVHLVPPLGSKILEGGHTCGKEYSVFDCDFGRIGIQICFDLSFPEGWKVLADKGAELVAVPTMSPQTSRPSAYALEGRYYVVTSNHRNNASIFNPAGRIDAQITDGDNNVGPGGLKLTQGAVLVHMVDLSFAVVPWSATLGDGRLFRDKYGDRVGFTYYRDEDFGIFWSNDPKKTISSMVREAGVSEFEPYLEQAKIIQDTARGGPAR